jgi:type III secretion protein S
MDSTTLVQELQAGFLAAAVFGTPPLVAAAAIGLVIGILQAITQIQDQALAQTIKILAVSFGLFLGGAILAGPLFAFTLLLFSQFAVMVR